MGQNEKKKNYFICIICAAMAGIPRGRGRMGSGIVCMRTVARRTAGEARDGERRCPHGNAAGKGRDMGGA